MVWGLGYTGNKGRTSKAKALPSLSLRASWTPPYTKVWTHTHTGGWVDKNRELFCCQQRLQVNIMDRKSPSPLCSPSLPFPSSPHPPSPTMHCLRASRVCCSVLTAHSTFSGSRLKLGGGWGKKRLVTSSARASGERSRGRKGQNNPGPASCHTAVRART